MTNLSPNLVITNFVTKFGNKFVIKICHPNLSLNREPFSKIKDTGIWYQSQGHGHLVSTETPKSDYVIFLDDPLVSLKGISIWCLVISISGVFKYRIWISICVSVRSPLPLRRSGSGSSLDQDMEKNEIAIFLAVQNSSIG